MQNKTQDIENKTFELNKDITFKIVRKEYDESKKDIFKYLNIKRI